MLWDNRKLWDIVNKDGYEIYINNDIGLKVKIIEENEEDIFFINYKGYNVTVPMLIWEFEADLELSTIENIRVVGDPPFDMHFVVGKKDKMNLLEEIYFFLVENNMDSVLDPDCKVDW